MFGKLRDKLKSFLGKRETLDESPKKEGKKKKKEEFKEIKPKVKKIKDKTSIKKEISQPSDAPDSSDQDTTDKKQSSTQQPSDDHISTLKKEELSQPSDASDKVVDDKDTLSKDQVDVKPQDEKSELSQPSIDQPTSPTTHKSKSDDTSSKKEPSDQELKKLADDIKQDVPAKFDPGQQQYTPDPEAIEDEKTELSQPSIVPDSPDQDTSDKKQSSTQQPSDDHISIQNPSSEDISPKEEEKPKKESFFKRFAKKITQSTSTLSSEHVDEIFEPLELILLENNVALSVVDKIKENLQKDLVGIEVKKGQFEDTILNSLKDSISSVLIEPPNLIEAIKNHKKNSKDPYTIIFFGINGSGKTTSIAKLAHKLKDNKISSVLVAADTFRAAAIQQLETHAKTIGVPIIKHDYGSDPTAVAFDAKTYAQKHNLDCVLIDTAGRMYTKENLIKQMEKIIRVIKPNLKIFVGESITGNDGTEQAKTFHEAVGIDGIILSKADVDEKGGTALSVSFVTGKPIYFLGTGQTYNDLQDFKKSEIIKNLGL